MYKSVPPSLSDEILDEVYKHSYLSQVVSVDLNYEREISRHRLYGKLSSDSPHTFVKSLGVLPIAPNEAFSLVQSARKYKPNSPPS